MIPWALGGIGNPGFQEPMQQKKCECGAHAVGSDKHSDYCPLLTKEVPDGPNPTSVPIDGPK